MSITLQVKVMRSGVILWWNYDSNTTNKSYLFSPHPDTIVFGEFGSNSNLKGEEDLEL